MPRATRSAVLKASRDEAFSADMGANTSTTAAEAANEDDAESQPPASFLGKLELSNFTFTLDPATVSSSLPPNRTTASVSPAKRNASPVKRARAQSTSATTTTKTRGKTTKSPHFPSKRQKSSADAPAAAPSRAPTLSPHLPLLPDAVGPNLLVLFVGLNPGIQTSRSGHAYAHPSNLFWKLMHSSSLTPTASPLKAAEDQTLPRRFGLGLTNIVARPSRSGADLSKAEMDAGVGLLHRKARCARAEAVCLVGKGIWDSVWRVESARRGLKAGGREKKMEKFKYGWRDESLRLGAEPADGEDEDGLNVAPPGWENLGEERMEKIGEEQEEYKGARIFVATSTSGLAASLSPREKEEVWKELGDWAQMRRRERVEQEEERRKGKRC
ncbi:TDG/mug DNA glucosyllase family protein [Zalerion maritima]|uniref:TDG/mug DNA glucosyllase family protein n=1 Tax=Zalerion maritima TaxID=339359 RepID=A0AAD5RM65_9PEZI|nr:TDG/mug DNA glucosyllase family protein [Zalerion maritima]